MDIGDIKGVYGVMGPLKHVAVTRHVYLMWHFVNYYFHLSGLNSNVSSIISEQLLCHPL